MLVFWCCSVLNVCDVMPFPAYASVLVLLCFEYVLWCSDSQQCCFVVLWCFRFHAISYFCHTISCYYSLIVIPSLSYYFMLLSYCFVHSILSYCSFQNCVGRRKCQLSTRESKLEGPTLEKLFIDMCIEEVSTL